MATTTQHAPGTFCWPELGTTDQQGAKKFYTTLFGWAFTDNDMGNGEVYTMLKLNGRDVGALYTLRKEQLDRGVPPHWSSYVAVENADQTAQKTKQLGGKVLMEPFDVFDIGRMAVLQDPTGATFCAWQAKKHSGAGVLGENRALCWTELITTDANKARQFYTGLLPWSAESMNMGIPYTVFKTGDTNAAGMMERTPQMGNAPPHWLIYIMVDNADNVAAKAKQLGGNVFVPPTDIPEMGRFSVLQDPQGAVFAVFTPAKRA